MQLLRNYTCSTWIVKFFWEINASNVRFIVRILFDYFFLFFFKVTWPTIINRQIYLHKGMTFHASPRWNECRLPRLLFLDSSRWTLRAYENPQRGKSEGSVCLWGVSRWWCRIVHRLANETVTFVLILNLFRTVSLSPVCSSFSIGAFLLCIIRFNNTRLSNKKNKWRF